MNTPTLEGAHPLIYEPTLSSVNMFDGISMLLHLNSYDAVDLITYTANMSLVTSSVKVRRIVASKVFGKVPTTIKCKIASHLHTKLYLCYIGKKLQSVFVGSWNFNSPTYTELCYCVPKKEHIHFKRYFDNVWGAAHGII